MSESETYQGKPTAYLDHNILDLFEKGLFPDFQDQLKAQFHLLYSDETLAEIERAGAYSENFLNVLADLGATHIANHLTNFVDTGDAVLSSIPPAEAFSNFTERDTPTRALMQAMNSFGFKHSGGRPEDGFSDILAEQEKAFSNFVEPLKDQLKELFPIGMGTVSTEDYIEALRFSYASNSQKLLDLMSRNGDGKNWSGVKDFRNALKLGPAQLNNITPPNVLQQVWNQVRSCFPTEVANLSLETFFGIADSPISPGTQFFNHQKVLLIYSMLNSVGYYPDSKMHKHRRFVAATSDAGHASIASFCNYLFSRDENFVMKVRAAYEYLGILTQVIHVQLSDTQTTIEQIADKR